MKIIEYNEKYFEQLESCDWSAAHFLAKRLKENSLENVLGGWAKIFLLIDGDALVSFITLSAQDCIAEPAFMPWLGFFYTKPEYRGHRYGKRLIDFACDLAHSSGYKKIYLATDHTGLYEKYGFCYLENRRDIYGDDSRIYIKELKNNHII